MTATNAPSYPNAASFPNELSAEQKAHEPSMDDILASIRRIIADDDALPLSRSARAAATPSPAAAAVPAAAPVPAPVAPVSAAPAADAFFGLGQRLTRQYAAVAAKTSPAPQTSSAPALAAVAPKPPMLKFRDFAPGREPTPAPAKEPAKEVAAPEVAAQQAAAKEIATKEIAAKEAPAKEVSAKPGAALSPAIELRPSLPEGDKPADPPKASVVTLVQPATNGVESRLKIASTVFRAPVFAPPAPEPAAEKPVPAPSLVETARPEPRAEQVPAPAAEQKPQEAITEPTKSEPPLLSAASGAKIGASFEALAESLLLRDPRMIERLTREMLRPMLKEWLDDNLPNVVERLVRAEIERVARGRD